MLSKIDSTDALIFSRKYFNIPHDFRTIKLKTLKDQLLIGFKLLSFALLIPPISIGIVYAMAKHFYNVKVIKEGEMILTSLKKGEYRFSSLLVPDVKKVCSAARKQFRKGKKAESKAMICSIKEEVNKKTAYIMEHLNSLNTIVSIELKTGLKKEALETAELIKRQIPELKETSAEIFKYRFLARLIHSASIDQAEDLMGLAYDRVNQFEVDLKKRYGKVDHYEAEMITVWKNEIDEERRQFVKNR